MNPSQKDMDSIMPTEPITIRTKRRTDDLNAICASFGLGGSPGGYKIITQVFLYKYFRDKFTYQAQKVEPSLSGAANMQETLKRDARQFI
ncbi:hypothetical protein [Acutalibacter intestini]|uniref:hypothetical protein n=1 Tax=Acutalibacter intestini TaxID=3093659 RepID=UPI002AC8BC8E|nr:hypothetical protein [Acutalibacter sp. M00204]